MIFKVFANQTILIESKKFQIKSNHFIILIDPFFGGSILNNDFSDVTLTSFKQLKNKYIGVKSQHKT